MGEESTSGQPIRILRDAMSHFPHRYGTACVKCAIMKDDGELYLYLADITVLHKDDAPVEERVQVYDHVVLAVVSLTVGELETLVDNLESGQIHLKALGTVNAKNSLQDRSDWVPSRTHYNGYYHDWPCRCFRVILDNLKHFSGMRFPMAKMGLPAYSNAFEACNAFFRHETAATQDYPVCVNFLIPDYGARIRELKIDGKEISVSVDSRELDMDGLVVQITCKRRGEGYRHSRDLEPGGGTAKFSTDLVPDEVFAYLLDSKDDKMIDSKTFSQYRPTMSDGITAVTSEESLDAAIDGGEDEHTEFKQDLDKDGMEFLESVISFANTKGGRILLGVSDDGKVVGTVGDFGKMDKRIRGIVNNRCKPNVAIKIEQVDLGGIPVIVVHVEEGKDKPYILFTKSAYKRVGRDDYPFERHDFDKIMNERLASVGMRRIVGSPLVDDV